MSRSRIAGGPRSASATARSFKKIDRRYSQNANENRILVGGGIKNLIADRLRGDGLVGKSQLAGVSKEAFIVFATRNWVGGIDLSSEKLTIVENHARI